MRCGWMRPSRTSFSRVSLPVSRRTGSKHDSRTASGVSSMIRLTPVVDSKALMLRPSRPMMRPFISSPGRCRTLTTDSAVCSVATRCTARVTILQARFSPSLRASLSISRMISAASRLAWFSMVITSSDFAWSAVSPATRSRTSRRFSSTWSSSARRSASSLSVSASFLPRSACPRASSSSRCSRSARRFSLRSRSALSSLSSFLSERVSSSTSLRIRKAASAATSALLSTSPASDSALTLISAPSRRAVSSSALRSATSSGDGPRLAARSPPVRRISTASATIATIASRTTAIASMITTVEFMRAHPSSRREPQHARGHTHSTDRSDRAIVVRRICPTSRCRGICPLREISLDRPAYTVMAIRTARSNSSLWSRLSVREVTSKQSPPVKLLLPSRPS